VYGFSRKEQFFERRNNPKLTKPEERYMAKMVRRTSKRTPPCFVSPRNADTARIDIERARTKVSGNPLTVPQRQQFEECLEKLFRKINLAGDFTLVDHSPEQGRLAKKGLQIGDISGNNVTVMWQPTENGMCFSYEIPMPSQAMAMDVRVKLLEANGMKEKIVSTHDPIADAKQTVLHLVQAGGSVAAAMTEAMMRPGVAMSQLLTSSITDVVPPALVSNASPTEHSFMLANGEPVKLRYRFETAELPLLALSQALEAELRQFECGENTFTIKRSFEVTLPKHERDGIHWCAYQEGRAGLGFYFRALSDGIWYRFALIPDNPDEFDITKFAEAVHPMPKLVTTDIKAGRVIDMQKTAPSFYNDLASAKIILNAMVEKMKLGRLTQLTSSEMTQLFRTHIEADFAPVAIGRVWTAWDSQGLIRRSDTIPATFTLGPKAFRNVAVHHLVFAREFVSASRLNKVATTPEVIITPPPAKVVGPTPAVTAEKVRPVVTPETFAGSVPDIAALMAGMQAQISKLAGAQEAQLRIAACDADITEKEAAVSRLLSEVAVLRTEREQLQMTLPPAEEILRMVRLLTPPK
jgi:hypothetical protein